MKKKEEGGYAFRERLVADPKKRVERGGEGRQHHVDFPDLSRAFYSHDFTLKGFLGPVSRVMVVYYYRYDGIV